MASTSLADEKCSLAADKGSDATVTTVAADGVVTDVALEVAANSVDSVCSSYI